jgi:hypothetical protein
MKPILTISVIFLLSCQQQQEYGQSLPVREVPNSTSFEATLTLDWQTKIKAQDSTIDTLEKRIEALENISFTRPVIHLVGLEMIGDTLKVIK